MVLNGDKKFMSKSEIKPVDVGNFPELSIKVMYADFNQREAVKPYMPPKINKGRQLDKEYFWNVINTLYEAEVEAIVVNAHRVRKDVDSGQLE